MTSQVVYFQIDILRPSRVHRSEGGLLMSVVGQKQTFRNVRAMSALPPKADIDGARWNVRFGPTTDIGEDRSLRNSVRHAFEFRN
jgi:hypothetical protein